MEEILQKLFKKEIERNFKLFKENIHNFFCLKIFIKFLRLLLNNFENVITNICVTFGKNFKKSE